MADRSRRIRDGDMIRSPTACYPGIAGGSGGCHRVCRARTGPPADLSHNEWGLGRESCFARFAITPGTADEGASVICLVGSKRARAAARALLTVAHVHHIDRDWVRVGAENEDPVAISFSRDHPQEAHFDRVGGVGAAVNDAGRCWNIRAPGKIKAKLLRELGNSVMIAKETALCSEKLPIQTGNGRDAMCIGRPSRLYFESEASFIVFLHLDPHLRVVPMKDFLLSGKDNWFPEAAPTSPIFPLGGLDVHPYC